MTGDERATARPIGDRPGASMPRLSDSAYVLVFVVLGVTIRKRNHSSSS